MTTFDGFDPEIARLAALTALRSWARQRDKLPVDRAGLVVSAWRAGERNLTELARIADVSRQTIYDDLYGHGINPATGRGAPPEAPRPVPLDHEQVTDLAERMAAVLLPSMIGPVTEPLATVAWTAHQIITVIGGLLDPDPPAGFDRAACLRDLAAYSDTIRRAAHRQWAEESSAADLARVTENAKLIDVELPTAAVVESATFTLAMPDGMTTTEVTVSTAGTDDREPEGWTTWTGALALKSVDGFRHLEVAALLAALSAVITAALPAELSAFDD